MARIVMSAVLTLTRLFVFFVAAVVPAVLDYIANRIGRVWLVLLATVVVRNGRLVFPFALLCEWLVGITAPTWVFTTSFTLSQFAHSLVFADLNMPYVEAWYHLFHQPVFPACYLFFCVLLHYPVWTIDTLCSAVSQAPHWLWSRTTVAACLGLLWKVPVTVLSLRVLVLWLKALCQWLWFASGEPAWRAAGKAVYDKRLAIQSWRDGRPVQELEPPDDTNATLQADREPFTHRPFTSTSQIRLLHILPRGNSNVVRCSMVHVDLDHEVPVFEAMSYTWSNPKRTHTIYIDGHPFRTTKNAHDLLWDCSPLYKPRPVWIDSVCINQDDLAEKSLQVQRMAYIYKRAVRVAVWLGTAPNAALAVNLILELNYIIEYEDFNDRVLYKRYSSQRQSPRWLALGDLLEHSYFTRVWMVQETSAQKDVHVMYGGTLLLWKTLSRVYTNIIMAHELSTYIEDLDVAGHRRAGVINAHQMLIIDRIREMISSGKRPSLQLVLMECWTLQATDARDKVFALWDVTADKYNPLVAPDYTKPVAQVFTDTAVYLAWQGPSAALEILPFAGVGWPRAADPLPSWAPDWTIAGRTVLAVFPRSVAGFAAAAKLPPADTRVTDDASLELDAIVLPGSIMQLGTEFVRLVKLDSPAPLDNSAMSDLTGRWLQDARQSVIRWLGVGGQNCPHTGQPVEEVVWRTLMADAGPAVASPNVAPFARPAAERYLRYYRGAMLELCGLEIGTAEERAADAAELRDLGGGDKLLSISVWVTTVQLRCMSRRLAFTADSHVCLVPPLTMPGDQIAVVPGLPVPLVVRPVVLSGGDPDERTYQLVGECYVHGIMDGEKADANSCQRIVLV
ncbi:HET domain-containing protein [Microdochium nivale]|nr:HET domain-containing protein [Microdochium nivale]